MDSTFNFIEPEGMTSWGGKDQITFKEIILRHINKISEISTHEFTGGYWEDKPVKTNGGIVLSKVYIEDRRNAYINAVDFLYDCLLPYFDKEMQEKAKLLNDELILRKQDFTTNENWMPEKLLIKRKMFQQLSLLLFRKDYLNKGVLRDG